MIEEGKGDLLRAEVDALVNTVNTQGVMGKGLALQFKRAFPAMFKEYKRACDAGDVRIGQMHVVRRTVAPRFIINFPTKDHWRQKSKLHDVREGLVDLVRQVQALGVESIAIPPLGCGLGGLDWPDVRGEIHQAFDELPGVRVILFAPRDAPAAKDIVHDTPRPKTTPSRASVVALTKK